MQKFYSSQWGMLHTEHDGMLCNFSVKLVLSQVRDDINSITAFKKKHTKDLFLSNITNIFSCSVSIFLLLNMLRFGRSEPNSLFHLGSGCKDRLTCFEVNSVIPLIRLPSFEDDDSLAEPG